MSKIKEYTSLVPLALFDSDVDVINLSDNLCIRRTNHTELESLIKRAVGFQAALESVLFELEYVIEKKMIIDTTKPWFLPWKEDSVHVTDIVNALRLFKEGHVETPTAFLFDSENSVYGLSNETPSVRRFEDYYFLLQHEVESFKALWFKVQNLASEKSTLKFPLFHYNRAFYRDTDEEVLLDYLIAFESLIFGGEKNSIEPAGKVIGIAIGMLLGTDKKQRDKIKRTFVDAYKIRNAYVHGNLDKLTDYKEIISEVTFCIEDYLRNSLRRFVEE